MLISCRAMIVIPDQHSPSQFSVAVHQSPWPRVVEMQVTVDHTDQVGTTIFGEYNSVSSWTSLFTRVLFVPFNIACTCQCTRKFCLLVRTLLRALPWMLKYMKGGNKVIILK